VIRFAPTNLLVIVLTIAACGGSDDSGWEAEFRETRAADFESQLSPMEQVAFCTGIDGVNDTELRQLVISTFDEDKEYTGSDRPLDELLAAYGEEYNAANVDKAVDIMVKVLRDAC